MWATAAVGAIAAFGYYRQATAGAAAIIILNVAVEPLIRAVDARVQRDLAKRTPSSRDSG
jgi:uncharacterized membrane protein YhiD involved in acid resistance